MPRRETPPPGEGGRPPQEPPRAIMVDSSRPAGETRDAGEVDKYLEQVSEECLARIRDVKNDSDLYRAKLGMNNFFDVASALALSGGGGKIYQSVNERIIKIWDVLFVKANEILAGSRSGEMKLADHYESADRHIKAAWQDDQEVWTPVGHVDSSMMMALARSDMKGTLHVFAEGGNILARGRKALKNMKEGVNDPGLDSPFEWNSEANLKLAGWKMKIKDPDGKEYEIVFPGDLQKEAQGILNDPRKERIGSNPQAAQELLERKVAYEEQYLRWLLEEVAKVYGKKAK